MKLQKKTSLGKKLGYQQCNHVERRNPGSEKYQSVLLEIGGKSWKQWVRNEEIGDNRKMKPWQFHFGQKVCSWYPGQPPAQWNTDGKSKEAQKHRWDNNERIKRRNEEGWKAILESSDYFCCINIAIIRATVAVICCPIVALLRKSGNTSFPLCNPSAAGHFIRKYFYQNRDFLGGKFAEIFLGRKLVKALISSEDNQTMGNFHPKGKSRRTNFTRNNSR